MNNLHQLYPYLMMVTDAMTEAEACGRFDKQLTSEDVIEALCYCSENLNEEDFPVSDEYANFLCNELVATVNSIKALRGDANE